MLKAPLAIPLATVRHGHGHRPNLIVRGLPFAACQAGVRLLNHDMALLEREAAYLEQSPSWLGGRLGSPVVPVS